MLEKWTGRPEDLSPVETPPVDPFSRWRKSLTLLFLAVGVIGIGYWLIRQPSARPIVIPVSDSATSTMLKVHVTGAVLRSGVYEIPEGQRVGDAIIAAGGALETADLTRINMAVRLRDQQQIIVPIRGAAPPVSASPGVPSSRIASPNATRAVTDARGEVATRAPDRGSTTTPELVFLNRATVAELARLPGIGTVTAERIIRHRQEFGSFTAIDELRALNLISSANWEKAKSRLTL